jgi:hypothetical protein
VPAAVASPANILAVQDILKEVWVADTLTSQLYEDMILFDYVEEVTEYTDSNGLKAVVPLKTGRSGGIGSRAIGDFLPVPDHQRVARATYNYTNHYLQVMVNGPVVARMETDRESCVREIDFEVTNGIEDFKHMLCRQLHGDGTGNILFAPLPGNASSTTLQLGASNFDVLDRGWLYEGMVLDVGTAAVPNQDSGPVGNVRITAIDDTAATPKLTLDQAITVTAGSGISLAGNRFAGAQSNEMNGLGNIISDTLQLGGLTPATSAYWKPARIQNGGTARALSIDLMLTTLRRMRMRGSYPDIGLTDLVTEAYYYKLLQGQVRFAGDSNLTAGNTEGLAFAKLKIVGDPEAVPGKIRFLRKKALQMYSAGPIGWQNQTAGGDLLSWVQNQDAFMGRAVKYCNLGTNRRRDFGVLEDLLTA